MATTPAFTAIPKLGFAAVDTANTNRDGTGTIVDALTAGSSGGRVERVVLQATGDPADSIVMMFIHDGTAYRLYDEFDLGNPSAASTTVSGYRVARAYSDLMLGPAMKIAFAITVALTSGKINCFVHGGDF